MVDIDFQPPPASSRRSRLRLRVLKGFAVVGIAMGLSLTLIITTPQNAQAFAPAPVIAGPVLLGGASGAAGAVTVSGLAAAAVPVLAVAAIAVGGYFLYQYADSKIHFPWEAGNPYLEDVPEGPGAGGQTSARMTYTGERTTTEGSTTNSPTTFIATIKYTPTPGVASTARTRVIAEYICRDKSNGTLYTGRSAVAGSTFSYTTSNQGELSAGTTDVKFSCSSFNDLAKVSFYPPKAEDVVGLTNPSSYVAPDMVKGWVADWYRPDGSNQRYETTVDCIKPDGTITTVKESDAVNTGNIPMPSCAVRGLGRAKKSVTNFLDGGRRSGAPMIDITEGDTAYTECDPAAGGRICKTEIYVDGQPCVVGAPACESWAGLNKANPGRVTCRYGGKLVHMSACAILEGAYMYGGSPMTKNNVDGDPNTWDPRRTIPGWVPNVVGPAGTPVPDEEHADDPEYDRNPEPEPDPDITTAPRPEPGTPQPSPSPSPSPSPTTSTGPSPQPSESPAPTDPEVTFPNPEGGRDDACGYQWAWNPFSWIGKQLQCAFIPKTDIKDRITTTGNLILTKPPMSWIAPGAIEGPSSSGCPDWTVTVGNFTKNVVCESAFIQAIVNVRTPLFNLVAAAMVYPLIRSIWYACIPILRVAPTSGGSK